jgi:CAAX protease family protein
LSSPPGPWTPSPPVEFSPPDLPPAPIGPVPDENPVWNALDVVFIVLATLGSAIFFPISVALGAKFLLFRSSDLVTVAQKPTVVLTAQILISLAVITFMAVLVKVYHRAAFLTAIRWNWPAKRWMFFLGSGVLLYLAIQGLGRILPLPKTSLPIDQFFRTPLDAYLLSTIAITIGPLVEELFFRGFLYPVLARSLGQWPSILLTGLGFGLIHALQLGRAWAPVFLIFLVGVVLTTVRAKTKSVAASLLVHIGYNGALSVLLFAATGGFRHLEMLNRP